MKTRDLTAQQFRDALTRNGMRLVGFLGYIDTGCGVHVGLLDASRRDRLAHALRAQSRELAKG